MSLISLQGFSFPRDLAVSETPDSLLLGSDVLLVLRTLRSSEVCLVPIISSQISPGTPPFLSESEEEDSDEDLASVSQVSVQGYPPHSFIKIPFQRLLLKLQLLMAHDYHPCLIGMSTLGYYSYAL